MQSPDITWKSWAMIATLGFVWGGTFLVIELALETTGPYWIAASRIAFAAALTLAFWTWRGQRLWLGPDRDWPVLGLVSVLSAAAPFTLIAWGQQYVTSAFTGISMASVGLMVLPLAHFLVPSERLSLRRIAGFAIGFAGVFVLMSGQGAATSGDPMEVWGGLACFGGAACYATSSVFMRRLPAVDSVGLSAATLAIGSVMVLGLALAREGMPVWPGGRGLLFLAFLGLVPTAAANLLRITTIRTAGPVFMSLTNYQVPLWSVSLGVLLLGEPFHASLLWALGLILCGVGLSQWGALRRLFRGA